MNRKGYALPSIIIIATIALITVTAFMQTLRSQALYQQQTYYTKLASEAAEAGLTYAISCMSRNANTPTWEDWRPLTEKTNCDGNQAPAANAPSGTNEIIASSDITNIRTRFVVYTPDIQDVESVTLSATGRVELLASNGSVIKTYTSIQKKFVNWGGRSNISGIISAPNRSCYLQFSRPYCWGDKRGGILGTGEVISVSEPASTAYIQMSPALVDGSTGLSSKISTQIVAGRGHSCVLTQDGEVWCWGDGYNGQVGNTRGRFYSPKKVTFPTPDIVAKDLGAWGEGTCAIVDKTTNTGGSSYSNKIMCWGSRFYGTTGANNPTSSNYYNSSGNAQPTPTLVTTGWGLRDLPPWYTALRLTKGSNEALTMCAVAQATTFQRRMWCWGMNKPPGVSGISMTGTSSSSTYFSKPYLSNDSSYLYNGNIFEITMGGTWNRSDSYAHGCAMMSYSSLGSSPDGILCWGGGLQGQLGNRAHQNVQVPNNFADLIDGAWAWPTGVRPVDVQAGRNHTCALLDTQEIWCWGLQYDGGMIGSGTQQVYYDEPYRVQGELAGRDITQIAVGENRSCALGSGFAYCWGVNFANQIGDGFTCDPPVSSCKTYNRLSPTKSRYLEQPLEQYLF